MTEANQGQNLSSLRKREPGYTRECHSFGGVLEPR